MNMFFQKFVKICPKTGRIRKITLPGGFYKLLFPIIGLAAMVWVLIRVIPKPSRLSYPCVKTAMPIASGFIGYLAMLVLSSIVFIRSKKTIIHYPVFFLGAFVVFGLTGFVLFDTDVVSGGSNMPTDMVVTPNQPMGVAQGIFPGRVVWIHNSNAVNQKCQPDSTNHAWWMAENNNQSTIDSMVSAAIDSLTGQKSDSVAWQTLFKYNNAARGKGSVGYVAGEKIFIKINECSGWSGNFDQSDLSKRNGNYYGMSETSPAMVLSVLHQLVDIVHVQQTDIYVGDPIRNIYKEWYEQWHPLYPNVHYIGIDNYANREKVIPSATAKICYSDRGNNLRLIVSHGWFEPSDTIPLYNDYVYTIFEDAEYLINLPQLKGHMRAGITLFAKNHFGSQTRGDAMHLHKGLPCPEEMENDTSRLGYGLYRIQVDLMTYSLFREKNLIFLLDGLWGTSFEQNKPVKWQMAPFSNTYSSSIFASLDNVAIESVGYDFLRSEFTIARCASLPANVYTNNGNTHGHFAFPQMRGADDYLHQAADSTNWPADIKYDPDSSGVHIYSLGVHEHWNNATDKKYSRNLGTGTGIQLMDVEQESTTSVASQENRVPEYFTLYQNYPNPFNPTTNISYSIPTNSHVVIKIYDIAGREVETIENSVRSAGTYTITFNAKHLTSGVYFYKLIANNHSAAKKFILMK
jgi:hypothetical protein